MRGAAAAGHFDLPTVGRDDLAELLCRRAGLQCRPFRRDHAVYFGEGAYVHCQRLVERVAELFCVGQERLHVSFSTRLALAGVPALLASVVHGDGGLLQALFRRAVHAAGRGGHGKGQARRRGLAGGPRLADVLCVVVAGPLDRQTGRLQCEGLAGGVGGAAWQQRSAQLAAPRTSQPLLRRFARALGGGRRRGASDGRAGARGALRGQRGCAAFAG
mmetsp:Transcript_77243/g.221247  ORF Transcript_77243/g.221247 Transcript_77243/m.221247 type:complete len:217 (+) Transcript_77243:1119-1769(+)